MFVPLPVATVTAASSASVTVKVPETFVAVISLIKEEIVKLAEPPNTNAVAPVANALTSTVTAPLALLFIVTPPTIADVAVIVKPSPTVTTAEPKSPVNVPVPSNAAVSVPDVVLRPLKSAASVDCNAVTARSISLLLFASLIVDPVRLAAVSLVIVAVTTPVEFPSCVFACAIEILSEIVRLAVAATTKEADVTIAAVSSACVPEIVTALVTVTAPDVLAPIALKSVASIAVPAASEIVPVAVAATTKESAVTNAAFTCAVVPEITTALVTVTAPDVLAPIALKSVASIAVAAASEIVAVAVAATTKEAVVTNAAVTCAVVPEITTALLTVTVPDVAVPIKLKSDADIAVAASSEIVTVAV